MNARNLKKLYRNFAKELIGVDVKIQVNNSWWYQCTNDIIGVSNIAEDMETEKVIADYFADIVGKDKFNYSLFTIGFLHELGHFWSKKVNNLDNEFFLNGADEVQVLTMLFRISGNSDYKQYYEQYAQIEVEKMANDFLFLFIYRHYEVVKKYDDIFYKIYGM